MSRASALFCCLSVAWAFGWAQVDWPSSLKNAKTRDEFLRVLDGAPAAARADRLVASLLDGARRDPQWKPHRDRLVAAWETCDRLLPAGLVQEAQADARRILSDPRYQDPGEAQGASWLGRTLRRAVQGVSEWLGRALGDARARAPSAGIPLSPLEPIVWAVLFTTLTTAVVWVLLNAKSKGLKRRDAAGALLAAGEPDRTADEWLAEADRLDAQGSYREAVRCLYLACLVRLDDAQVAAFVNTETNWEHVRRIEKSPALPAGVNLRPVTRLFERVWYGRLDLGPQAAAELRRFYLDLLSRLRASGRIL